MFREHIQPTVSIDRLSRVAKSFADGWPEGKTGKSASSKAQDLSHRVGHHS